mmetsp:Transcript_35899/g.76624  ORF Transcript_35899/g.76624 Transcript_35899/m.76624 type:complete len:222 (+) Transcript_35899:219-884(+)
MPSAQSQQPCRPRSPQRAWARNTRKSTQRRCSDTRRRTRRPSSTSSCASSTPSSPPSSTRSPPSTSHQSHTSRSSLSAPMLPPYSWRRRCPPPWPPPRPWPPRRCTPRRGEATRASPSGSSYHRTSASRCVARKSACISARPPNAMSSRRCGRRSTPILPPRNVSPTARLLLSLPTRNGAALSRRVCWMARRRRARPRAPTTQSRLSSSSSCRAAAPSASA